MEVTERYLAKNRYATVLCLGTVHIKAICLVAASLCMTMMPSRLFGAAEMGLPDVHGRVHQLSDYRGQWVVLNFWATWCPPCLEEIPDLSLFHEAYKDKGALVIGVNFEDVATPDLMNFIHEQFIDYTVLRMEPNADTPLGRVFGLPTTFIISPDGEVAKVHIGAVTFVDLEEYIQLSPRKPYESQN